MVVVGDSGGGGGGVSGGGDGSSGGDSGGESGGGRGSGGTVSNTIFLKYLWEIIFKRHSKHTIRGLFFLLNLRC